jgi:signal transduction histidine kinase
VTGPAAPGEPADHAPGHQTPTEDDALQIISTVAHELRSPLTSLKGFSKLLLDRWDRIGDDDKRSLVGQMQVDADRLARLVNELLDISRIEAGRVQIRRSTIDLSVLLHGVFDRLVLVHPQLAITWHLPDTAPVLWADRDKVAQIVTNLVENAAKYAAPDSIHIEIREDVSTSTDDTDPAGVRVRVIVDDAGPGIPDDELEAVFSRFYRREVAQPSGTGLGLWISRSLAEAHGGTLEARPNSRGGTSFCLSLPRGEPEGLA